MAQITYDDKSYLDENPSIPDVNKVTDDDMNEIKSVVNTNDNTTTTAITGLQTYSTTETNTGKVWTDGKTIYRQVFNLSNYGNLQNGSAVSCPVANMETLIFQDITYFYNTRNVKLPLVESNGNTLQGSYDTSTQKIYFSGAGSWQARSMRVILEYTKTS